MKATRDPGQLLSAAHSGEQSSWKLPLAPAAFMSENEASWSSSRRLAGLDAHEDARTLVRLVQCPQCSLPFKVPVTLPCGHSVCRTCLPQSHRRENISYPNTPDRLHGIRCPAEGCGQEHPVSECNIDVCLSKVMESISAVVESFQPLPEDTLVRLSEIPDGSQTIGKQTLPEEPQAQVLAGGRLLATFALAEMGKLHYHVDVCYESISKADEGSRKLDQMMLSRLRDMAHRELDCHVCYNLMYDPVTTPCGHTFCRKCLVRVLDHSTHCPVCRRTLPMPPSLERQASNVRLVALLLSLCSDLVSARAEAIAADERAVLGDLDTPLFVCTLAFPSTPTFLHIFEPRYKLMIRRAMENNRQFGMLTYNQIGASQSELGVTNFKEYGTMLHILNVHMLPDGRSLIETQGLYRFRVRAHGILDGYTVGRVERVEDISLAEEERLEVGEISASALPPNSPMLGLDGLPAMAVHSPASSQPADLSQLSTQQLLIIGLDFIQKMRAHSAPWLHQRIIEVHGDPPNDPALFPYWFASIIPIVDDEKYQLLATTSVRERLKIVIGWIRRIENQRWYSGGSCMIL